MERTPARRLTPDEKERIIEMRLAGVSVRTVAAAVDTSTRTVVDTFKKYCKARAEEFREQADPVRAHIIERLFRIANDAAKAGSTARDSGEMMLHSKYLAEERAALVALGKWFEGPVRIEHSGDTGFTVVRIIEEIAQPEGE